MVQITKKTILWVLTILTIGAFVLEFFVVIMWAPQGPEATATPTPAAQTFTGSGYMPATVIGFDSNVLIECNRTSSSTAAELEAIPGISTAFLASDAIIAARLNKSFSSAEFAPIAHAINSTLSKLCSPSIVRGALIKVSDAVTVTGTAGQNATIYPRELEAYAYYAGQSAPIGFVNAGTAENESIQMVASASFQQGQLVQFFAQQIEFQAAEPVVAGDENFTVEIEGSEEWAGASNESVGNYSAGANSSLPSAG